MDDPLFAYLMLRSCDGTWSVKVCSTFGSIVSKWNSLYDRARVTAVLHVGRKCPNYQSFDDIAGVHLGCMLLTEAARDAFPATLVASSLPVGIADNFTVFMALEGWGYAVRGPTLCVNRSERVKKTVTYWEPKGWVSLFLNEYPWAKDTLSTNKICDEETYLGGESGLNWTIRHRLGVFRAHYLAGINCEDPCKLAAAAPPWLLERDLTTFMVSTRARVVFFRNDIKTVADLADWSSEALLRQKDFGNKSHAGILQALNNALDDGPSRDMDVKIDHSKPQVATKFSWDYRNWVVSFLKDNPCTLGELSQNKIYDEETYLKGECGLTLAIRHRMGVFRAHYLVGTECKDPCKLAAAAPPWLLKRKLTTLKVSARAKFVFNRNKMRTVWDLGKWSSGALLLQRDFGDKSCTYTLEALNAALEEGPIRYAGANSDLSKTESAVNSNRIRRDWVAWFLKENPWALETLVVSKIYDEETYLERESELNWAIRHLLGVFRAHYLARGDCDDLCKCAAAAPPWLLERKLATLIVSVRAQNMFERNNINTVADLANWSSRALLLQREVGNKSYADTLQALNAALNGGPARTVGVNIGRREPNAASNRNWIPRDWITSFLQENPWAEETLLVNKISDEETYWERESELNWAIRHRLGVFRAHYLAGSGCYDLCKCAAAAPPWLLKRQLTTPLVSKRAQNVFERNNIKSVADLARWSSRALLAQRGFGNKSYTDTLQALNAALNGGPAHSVGTNIDSRGPNAASNTNSIRCDWFASFLKENPWAEETLLANNIYDEETYVDGEVHLEWNTRHRLGVFRAYFLAGFDCDDPCKLAAAAPPWLLGRRLSTLRIPPRALNVFSINSIETVRDLSYWSSDTLLGLKSFGCKSYGETLKALNAGIDEGPSRESYQGDREDLSSLLSEIRQSLLLLSERERYILVKRLGFGVAAETLQEVANRYTLTRERVRQIEKRAIQIWIRESSWSDAIEERITQLLRETNFPLPVAGVEAIDPWFKGMSLHVDFFRRLIRYVCGDRVHIIDVEGLGHFSFIDQVAWERNVEQAEALLVSGVGEEWTEAYAQSLVKSLLPEVADEFGTILWEEASRMCHFSTDPSGLRILTGYGRGSEQVVKAILAESNTPLHYTEIAKLANFRYGKNVDLRTIHNAAVNVAFLFSRGTYGLAQHVPLLDEEMYQIRVQAEAIVCSGAPGRQWHTSEILAEVSQRLDVSVECLDKYLLDIALAKSKRLKSLKRMIWTPARRHAGEDTRIDLHQAVISLVTKAGRPLRAREIKERLTQVRGVNEFFQIHAKDPLIRVKPGVWGIKGRDLPLTLNE